MIKVNINHNNRLYLVLFLSFFVPILLTNIIYTPNTVSADTVVCKDGSVHSLPSSSYACLKDGEGGVDKNYPYENLKPGDKCPKYWGSKSGKTIPAGKDQQWCGELTDEDQKKNTKYESCLNDGGVPNYDTGVCDFSGNMQVNYKKHDCQGADIRAGLQPGDANYCGILNYLVIIINVLAGAASVAIIGSIIYAGIQYSMSGSDPQKVSAAKDRIRNAIIALVFFIFGYTILNYLVPGGVL